MNCYLYKHFDENNQLLYVGISYSVYERTIAHSKSAKWFERVSTIKVEKYDNRADARCAERLSIKTENPAFNISESELSSNKVRARYIKCYSKITKTEIINYISGGDLYECANKLNYKSKATVKNWPEILSINIFNKIIMRMKAKRIPVPKDWL